MEHVMQVCDQVLVLRLGRLVADRAVAELDSTALVEYITGLRSDFATVANGGDRAEPAAGGERA
jgi:ABC-type sugar transport system ATPase subunit